MDDDYTCATCRQFKDCQAAFGEIGQVGIGCADWERPAPDYYMNVWRSYGDYQWTDITVRPDSTYTRDFADRVAANIDPATGIKRLGVLRVRLKDTTHDH